MSTGVLSWVWAQMKHIDYRRKLKDGQKRKKRSGLLARWSVKKRLLKFEGGLKYKKLQKNIA